MVEDFSKQRFDIKREGLNLQQNIQNDHKHKRKIELNHIWVNWAEALIPVEPPIKIHQANLSASTEPCHYHQYSSIPSPKPRALLYHIHNSVCEGVCLCV